MIKVGTKFIRIQTGQCYVVEGIGRSKRIGCLVKKDRWYRLKHINGPVDLLVRSDELKKLFKLY